MPVEPPSFSSFFFTFSSPSDPRRRPAPTAVPTTVSVPRFPSINDSAPSASPRRNKNKTKKTVGFPQDLAHVRHLEPSPQRISCAPKPHHRRPHPSSSSSPSPVQRSGSVTQRHAHSRMTSLAELKERRSSMIASKPHESRRDRTFIGATCAACDEPLEHTLRGERILQLSCGHVAHEACFYEYIKEFDAQTCPDCDAPLGLDTRRGGGIDFENFNKLVRAAAAATPTPVAPAPAPAHHHHHHHIDHVPTREPPPPPSAWEHEPLPRALSPTHLRTLPGRMTREHLLPDHTRAAPSGSTSGYGRNTTHGSGSQHGRHRSGDTAAVLSNSDYADTQHTTPMRRQHDYDVQSMETTLSGPPRHHAAAALHNPIPAPLVTVRSEFPTLNRSRQQQSLTCLITVEVIDGSWQPSRGDDAHPPLPPLPATIPKEPYGPPSRQPQQPLPAPPTSSAAAPPPKQHVGYDSVHEDAAATAALAAVKTELYHRCENWHGLDFARFGRLLLYGPVRVGKDRRTWQELECYLFSEMLICVKAKKGSSENIRQQQQQWNSGQDLVAAARPKTKVSLKGAILIKRHLEQVETMADDETLSLALSVPDLSQFHLQFQRRATLETWRSALLNLNHDEPREPPLPDSEHDTTGSEEDDYGAQTSTNPAKKRVSSMHSSTYGASRSQITAPTEYTNSRVGTATTHEPRAASSSSVPSLHVPLDIVVVVPVSSSMQGLKISLLRDALRFLVASLGERDRMGLVTFGAGGGGGMPLVGMTTKRWAGWAKVLEQVRPVGQKHMRADVVEGANVAVDLLMQRKTTNPLSSILLISDAAAADADSVDFVVSRAEAAKITIHSFGLGLTHKPDTLVELSTRTKASYVYVKDWMMLRECLGGCLGSLQSTSHQNVKLKLRLPEGSPAKFVKINGALAITKRATGRHAEASLGDLRFGDKRDVLVQLAIASDASTPDSVPEDPWENMISGLEALGGPLDSDESRTLSVEELPLLQADLCWGDILRDGGVTQLPRPSLLAITVLPSPPPPSSSAAAAGKRSNHHNTANGGTAASGTATTIAHPSTPPIPPHPQIVQRRMELLTSDMLSRALTLISRGQHDRASHLLAETRSILKGLGKGGLPPLPPSTTTAGSLVPPPPPPPPVTPLPATPSLPSLPNFPSTPSLTALPWFASPKLPQDATPNSDGPRAPSPPRLPTHDTAAPGPPASPLPLPPQILRFGPATTTGIDTAMMTALDAELTAGLEWIAHPAVFARDTRKAVLQAIGVISSQRAYSFRSPAEALCAARIPGVRRLTRLNRDWREVAAAAGAGEESLLEESS